MRAVSSKAAKSHQISKKVRQIVEERDDGLCIVCGRKGYSNAHYVPRSAGGMGIEENIVTLCPQCHRNFDFGDGETMAAYGEKIKEYLKRKYPGWDEEKLKYKKYGDDYGI